MTTQFPILPWDKKWELAANNWMQHHPLWSQTGTIVGRFAPEMWGAILLWLWLWPPRPPYRMRRAVVYAAVSGAAALLISVIVSHLLPYRPRPFIYEPQVIHASILRKPDMSFPSRHAAESFGVATGLFFAGYAPGLMALILAAVVAVARVSAGLHWPTDALGGAAVGILTGLFMLSLRGSLEWLIQLLFRIFRMEPEHTYGRRW